MKIFIYGKDLKEKDVPYIDVAINALRQYDMDVFVFDEFLEKMKTYKQYDLKTFSGYEDVKNEKPKTFLTLGGDGTILSAMTKIKELGTPILGINLGRLGFLASIEKTKIKESIQDLSNQNYVVESRKMLSISTSNPIFGDTPFALNDFTISKRDTSALVTIHSYINGEFLNSYWADGIIVATPTGSTGYSLSCGGPIVFPGTGNFVITPVAPHNLNVRPIVIPDNVELTFKIEGRAESYLCTLDSRYESVSAEQEIRVTRCDFYTNLLVNKEERFMNTIRSKLYWGVDKRN